MQFENGPLMKEFTLPPINSMKLIQLVRAHESLYNSNAAGYNDQNRKEEIWEYVHKELYPTYGVMNKAYQEIIRANVRRRWKALRNAMAKEVRRNALERDYVRKKESPILDELEFLIPHIKSTHCTALVTNAWNARENNSQSTYVMDEPFDAEEEEDVVSAITDSSDELEIKPDCKLIPTIELTESNEQVMVQTPERVLFSASVRCDTSRDCTDSIISSTPNNWTKEYYTLAEFKEGEFTHTSILDPSCKDMDERDVQEVSKPDQPPLPPPLAITQSRKRTYSEIDSDHIMELQTKILQLLTRLEKPQLEIDPNDEDRMFLMSLVSDLKRVNPAKKMLVKAEIVTAIARNVD